MRPPLSHEPDAFPSRHGQSVANPSKKASSILSNTIFLPLPATNQLAGEEPRAGIHRVVKFALGGAVGAHRNAKKATDPHEKALRQAELSAYISIVIEAITIHEAGPILWEAITVQNIHDVRRLHIMAMNISTPDAA